MATSSCCSSRGERRTTASASTTSAVGAVEPDVLIVEPFYCGSHKQLVDCLMRDEVLGPRVHLVTMSGKKWHWRARVSALHLTSAIPRDHHFRVLFSSSVLNLAELVALRPDLASLHKVLYFHENQLQYPVRKQKERDFQYGYNQILSCLVADSVLFNSAFNMESFLTSITSFLKLMPDYRPKGLTDTLRPKCSVVHFPMQYPTTFQCHANHQSQFSKNLPNTPVAFPADHGHGVKQNVDRTACFSSSVDMQAQDSEGDQAFVSRTVQMNSCGDAVSQAGQAHRCADFFKSQADSSDRTESMNPQAKVGRLDCEVAAGMEDGDCHLRYLGQDSGGDCDFRSPVHRPDSSTSALSGSCVKRSYAPDVQTAPKEISTGTSGESVAIMPSSYHHQRRAQDHPSPCKDLMLPCKEKDGRLHIVWPHRWEHDKDPQTFFQALFRLQDDKLPFVVSVLGETFTDVPDIFAEAERRLKDQVFAWGYQADKSAYFQVLQQADVVVSTSIHEFFGVAVLEAVYLGCYPLCPKSLVYPELYPEQCLYSTPNQLYKRLRSFCLHPHLPRQKTPQIDLQRFSWDSLRPVYLSKLQINS